MTRAPPVTTSVAFSGVGGINNAVVWIPFAQSPTVLFVDLVRLGSFMGPLFPYRCLARKGTIGREIIAENNHRRCNEEFVALSSRTRRRDGRLVW